MAWYRIIIKRKNIKKPLVGLRYFEETVFQKIEKEIRDKTLQTIKQEELDDIQITKIPPDHPEVLALIGKKN
jgi:hypothetical protein